MSDSLEFDWYDVAVAADIIIPEQPAIACYTNTNGGIVLRQAGHFFGSPDDQWIFFHPQHARALATAILEEAGLDVDARTPSKDCTAAERQRRYRERKRNGDGVTPVTRNAKTVTQNHELQLVAAE